MLVRALFSNAKLTYKLNNPCDIVGFETHILGKEMYTDVEELGEIFSMRDDGLTNEEVDIPLEFPIVKERASDLPLFPRILHLIIT